MLPNVTLTLTAAPFHRHARYTNPPNRPPSVGTRRRQLSSPFWLLSSPQMLIISLTGLAPERVQLAVHTTEPTGTVPEPFHCDHIARLSARSGTTGRSGTGLNTSNWNGSGPVPVPNLWCEHSLIFRQVAVGRRGLVSAL